jgi:UDP-N-acetylmuramate--alanine ligase
LFLENVKKVYFIGIGGVSMSGLAELTFKSGRAATGSDRGAESNKFVKRLRDMGIEVHSKHEAKNITDDIDLVVYTVAVAPDNPELLEAARKGVPTVDRAELLGEIMKGYSKPICVSGAHGKTTTTSMISQILLESGSDPTISVGGNFAPINGNFRIGGKEFFVAEACEYYDSFLKFFPYIGIILNVEADHLDYFKDLRHIRNSFAAFAKNVRHTLVINKNIPDLEELTDGLNIEVITYGIDGDVCAENITYDSFGAASFEAYIKGELFGAVTLRAPGEHNVYNALAAICAALAAGVPKEKIVAGLAKFTGAERRFEFKGEYGGFSVFDDYAHHPTEIKSTLAAAKKMNYNKIICVFQPHTYSRTLALFKEFTEAFDDADLVLALDIYAAREIDSGKIHSRDLVKALNEKNIKALYIKDFNSCVEFLEGARSENTLLITMGAGDVHIAGEMLINKKLSTLSTGA